MPRIVNNRICYPTHNILCEFPLATGDPALEVAFLLNPEGTIEAHRQALNTLPDSHNYRIELPHILLKLVPGDKIRAICTLSNGNFPKELAQAECKSAEGFQPLWQQLAKKGIQTSLLQRKRAEMAFNLSA